MILITGASSGIGEACARVFAKEGRSLLLVARRIERLERLAERLRKSEGADVRCFRLDVSNRKVVEAFTKKHSKLLTRVEVLINNAGLARGMEPIQEGRLEDWDAMIDTNLKGLLYLTRSLIPGMVARKRGHVVNLGSVAAQWIYPKGNVYCATKAAVRALTQAMRLDLNGSGVRVSEISPGMVQTEFSEVRLRSKGRAQAVYAGMTPLSAADVAEAVAWCVNRPAHVNVQELILYPVDQASTTVVSRRV